MVYLKYNYFEDFWNLFLMISYGLNLFCVLEHTYDFAGCNYDTMINVGAIAVCVQWCVLYYWMRLVPELAQFVTFLIEVVKDISGFVVMFVICLLMCGNAIYLINASYADERSSYYNAEEIAVVIPPAFKNTFANAILDQY